LKERWRSSFDALKQRFVLTREEKRVIIFIAVAFALGLTVRHYRGAHSPIPDKIDNKHSYSRAQRVSPPSTPERRFKFDECVIDLDARQLRSADNSAVSLTDAEFDLLACLVQRPRRVLSRDDLFKSMRGRIPDPLDRAIDMIVSRLRRKLAAASANPDLITTVRNGGYLLTAHVERAP